MLLKILLITLTAISLSSCGTFETPPPKEPDYHDCSVVVIKDSEGEYIWDEAYVFCALHRDPQNIAFHERWPLLPFLLGSHSLKEIVKTDDGPMKPRLLKGRDYLKLSKWKNELVNWAEVNCKKEE